MDKLKIRALDDKDRPWVNQLLRDNWGSVVIVSRGKAHRGDGLPGFIAVLDGQPAGLLTYDIAGSDCEITSINSLAEGWGIGSALVEALKQAAAAAGYQRLWLITTNDNTAALRFWQKRGFTLVAVYPDAIEPSRRLKPEIPMTGNDGIPIRDEIELEIILG
jgi:ribosomal protein S18 acetylase RimI-like enzyme